MKFNTPINDVLSFFREVGYGDDQIEAYVSDKARLYVVRVPVGLGFLKISSVGGHMVAHVESLGVDLVRLGDDTLPEILLTARKVIDSADPSLNDEGAQGAVDALRRLVAYSAGSGGEGADESVETLAARMRPLSSWVSTVFIPRVTQTFEAAGMMEEAAPLLKEMESIFIRAKNVPRAREIGFSMSATYRGDG